ncbi:MAG: hypothetical protein P0S96_01770 [Simkaniaceae bacterium]|nr:hypothetical protein [Candidatus Sacchlamyda saccharinae]
MVVPTLDRIPFLMVFIPSWSFFAPIPGMHDYNLMFRGITKEGQVLEWDSVFKLRDKRGFFSFFWNPEKKFLKSLMDIAQELLKFSNSVQHRNQICISIPYLLILNFITALNHIENVEKVQFMILSNSRLYDYEVLFLSEPHFAHK